MAFGYHPANLGVRFLLEIAALVSIGIGAYSLSKGPPAWLLAVALPVLAAVIWAVFDVPGDRTRSGAAPVPVTGRARLLIEFGFFLVAVLLLSLEFPGAAVALGAAVVIHYLLSTDRLRWLLANQ